MKTCSTPGCRKRADVMIGKEAVCAAHYKNRKAGPVCVVCGEHAGFTVHGKPACHKHCREVGSK